MCPPAIAANLRSVFLIDESPAICIGLRSVISSQMLLQVCGESHDPAVGLEFVAAKQPTVVITEIQFSGTIRLDHLAEMHRRAPRTSLLVFTGVPHPVLGERAIRAGARGFMSKREPVDQLGIALQTILTGNIYASQPLLHRLLESFGCDLRHQNQKKLDPLGHLSCREHNVLLLLGQGLSTTEIGARLDVRSKTIQTYYRRMKRKLQLNTFNDLVRYAGFSWSSTRELCRGPESGFR